MTRRIDNATLALVVVVAVLGASLSLHAPAVRAQEPPSAPSPAGPTVGAPSVDPNALTPPRLLAFVDAGYPEAARAEQREASVLLGLTIGDDGFVEEATLLEPPVGYGFDELALSAARRFVFEPAAKAGQPIRARIQYRYEFKFQPIAAAAPAAEAPPEARVTVSVRSAENDRPLPDAELILSSPSDPNFALRLLTDERGSAHTEQLIPGSYELSVSHPSFKTERHTEELTEGQTTELTYRLERARSEDEYGAVARVKAPAREVTRRTIEREELTRVAGTRGDALRTIELLPGVSRPPFGAGLVLIRGSAPGDSVVLLDGVPVPLLYHFGGLTSFINSRALERIDFYPGNFSVRYGRALGGIVDVGVRDPSTEGYHGVLDVNLPLDSSLLVEGPLGKKASFMVAGRRSYAGEVIEAVIPKDAFGAFAAPVYYDYQGFVSYRPTDRDRLRLGLYGSSDALDVLFADDTDPSVKGLEIGNQFHRAQLGWRRQYTERLDHDVQLSLGREDNVFKLPPAFDLDIAVTSLYLRAEWRYRISRAVQVIAGTDSTLGTFSVSYEGPSLPDSEQSGASRGFEALPTEIYRKRGVAGAVSGYLELALTPVRQLRIVPGLRVDYFSLIDGFTFDPRVAAIYSLSEQTRLKAGVGIFSQPPQPPEALKGFGNPELRSTQAIHYSAGVEHDFSDELSLNLEGFYKSVYKRVVGTDYQAAAAAGVLDPPPFDNDGIGRIYGLEVAGRKQAKGRWFGFLSYTLMRSERKDHDEPWRPYQFDQTHIFSAAATLRLGRGWEMGGTVRIVTGNPNTPIVGASLDLDTGTYAPENGRPNSSRSANFGRFDLRFEKTWRFDRWRLALYLDIQNATNQTNPEGVQYSFNYKQRNDIRGIPVLPVLGLRGEL